MRYFLIRDDLDANHIIAIHRVMDSALACFSGYITSGDFEDHLELVEINTNERGIATHESVIVSYSKRLRSVSCIRADILAIVNQMVGRGEAGR